MYAPNQYYQPYTSSRESTLTRSRRNSTSSQVSTRTVNSTNNNNNEPGDVIDNSAHNKILSEEKKGLCNVKCCCFSFVLLFVSVLSVAGILVWVLNRNEVLNNNSESLSNFYEDININVDKVDNLSDVSSLLHTESEAIKTTTKLKNDNIVFPKDRSDFFNYDSSEELSSSTLLTTSTTSTTTTTTTTTTTAASKTTSKPKVTTYEPRYTEIITKMKEMRKQRLSNKRFFGSSIRDDEDLKEDTTTPLTITLARSSTTSTIPKVTEKLNLWQLAEEIINDSENDPEDKIETTTINDVIKDPLKTSKFLRFEKEVLFNHTRNERNHRQDKTPEQNTIEKSNAGGKHRDILESSKITSIAASRTISKETIKTIRETDTEQTTSSKVFFAYPDVPKLHTYTIAPETEVFCKYFIVKYVKYYF